MVFAQCKRTSLLLPDLTEMGKLHRPDHAAVHRMSGILFGWFMSDFGHVTIIERTLRSALKGMQFFKSDGCQSCLHEPYTGNPKDPTGISLRTLPIGSEPLALQ